MQRHPVAQIRPLINDPNFCGSLDIVRERYYDYEHMK